jgi:putative lipoprotein
MVLVLAVAAGCTPKPAVPDKSLATLEGTITYRQRVALSPEAIVKVWLQDLSKADAVPEMLDEVEIRNPGQVPIAFRVKYDPQRIVSSHRYTLLVKIYEGDRTRFLNAASYPVITQGCTDHCEVVLDMMR